MELVDAHVHLLYPDRFTYSWCRGNPILDQRYHLEDFRAAALAGDGLPSIKSLIYMEADVPAAAQGAEVELAARLAEDRTAPAVDAIIAAAWPESDGFAERIETLAHIPRIRGVRRVLHTQPAAVLRDPRLVSNLRLLSKHNLTFDLCLRPHQLAAANELIDACSETQFVLDHCCAPDVAAREIEGWKRDLAAMAARGNVTCKFSGLASLCDPSREMTPQVRPYFEHCLECFGPQRIMWGSDWPLCNLTFSLNSWIETSAHLLSALNAEARAEISKRTAERVYRLS